MPLSLRTEVLSGPLLFVAFPCVLTPSQAVPSDLLLCLQELSEYSYISKCALGNISPPYSVPSTLSFTTELSQIKYSDVAASDGTENNHG